MSAAKQFSSNVRWGRGTSSMLGTKSILISSDNNSSTVCLKELFFPNNSQRQCCHHGNMQSGKSVEDSHCTCCVHCKYRRQIFSLKTLLPYLPRKHSKCFNWSLGSGWSRRNSKPQNKLQEKQYFHWWEHLLCYTSKKQWLIWCQQQM